MLSPARCLRTYRWVTHPGSEALKTQVKVRLQVVTQRVCKQEGYPGLLVPPTLKEEA